MLIENKSILLQTRLQKMILLSLIIAFLFIYNASKLMSKQYTYLDKIENLNYVISQEISLVNFTREQIAEYNKAKKLWENINFSEKNKNGIEIAKAKILIEDLSKIYKLSDEIKISISEPRELRNVFFYDNKLLVTTNLSINFKTYTDELFFGFVDALERNFPGFLKFTALKVKKISNLDDKILEGAKTNKFKYLIEGEIEFEWNDFKVTN